MYKMECEYCHKKYSSMSSLNNHKKTNKKCITEYRGAGGTELLIDKITCNNCQKQFSSHKTLGVHMKGFCKIIKEEKARLRKIKEDELKRENLELKKQLKKKDDDFKKLAMKALSEPRTVVTNNNNTINNHNNKYNFVVTNNFSVESFGEVIDDEYTQANFLQGQRGVAYFARDKLLTDKETGKLYYYCSDTGRKIFVMKDKKGNIVKDCKSVKLTELLMSAGIVEKSISHYRDILRDLEEYQKQNNESIVSFDRKRMACVKNLSEIQDMETNNAKFVAVLSRLVCNNPCNGEEEEGEGDCIYEIEIENDWEDEEEEEDLSQYTEEYFARQETLIEKLGGGAMYNRCRESLEKERRRVDDARRMQNLVVV